MNLNFLDNWLEIHERKINSGNKDYVHFIKGEN
jgi:hypothetical protein